MLTLGQTGFSTGSCNCLVNNLGVAQCINNLLCNQNFVTDGAMLTLGQTGLGAGCGNRGNHFLSMGSLLGLLLSNQDLTTHRALLAFSQAGLGAGCGNRGNHFLSMGSLLGLLLSNQDLTALRALLALGQAGLGAGCRNSRNNFFGVSSGNDAVLNNRLDFGILIKTHTGNSSLDRIVSACRILNLKSNRKQYTITSYRSTACMVNFNPTLFIIDIRLTCEFTHVNGRPQTKLILSHNNGHCGRIKVKSYLTRYKARISRNRNLHGYFRARMHCYTLYSDFGIISCIGRKYQNTNKECKYKKQTNQFLHITFSFIYPAISSTGNLVMSFTSY